MNRGYETAIEAAVSSVEYVCAIEENSPELICARIANGGTIRYDKPTDLTEYDNVIKEVR